MLTDRISTLPLTPPVTVQTGTPVGRVVDEVQKHKVGCVLVYEAGRMIGIVTERDMLLKVVARDVDYTTTKIDDFMTRDPVTLSPNDSIADAAALMTERHFRHIPIIAGDGTATGIVSIKDIIQLLAESFPEQVLNLPPRPHQRMETPEGG
ncbi:MAG: CBS domain-containing protein [Chloroflexota bacterium]